ncbi:hypothetical protein A2U01_0032191, partial [Trifolium medium]|nr:hypothetical protein [Trifolium medium]
MKASFEQVSLHIVGPSKVASVFGCAREAVKCLVNCSLRSFQEGNKDESCHRAEEVSGYDLHGFRDARGSMMRCASPSASNLGGTDAAARIAQPISPSLLSGILCPRGEEEYSLVSCPAVEAVPEEDAS